MSKRHRNIFYYFRGGNYIKDEEKQSNAPPIDKQIENNTTKALINVFEYSEPDVLKAFVKKILGIEYLTDKTKFFIQDMPRAIMLKNKKKYIVGISSSGEVKNSSIDKEKGRPDAWILNERMSIAFEVKTNILSIGRDQIRRHLNIFGDKISYNAATKNEKLLKIKWIDIYNFFENDRTVKKNCNKYKKTKFIVEHFIEYLEVVNLTKFIGFDSDDFAVVFDHEGPKGRSNEWESVRNKFLKLIEELKQKPKSEKKYKLHFGGISTRGKKAGMIKTYVYIEDSLSPKQPHYSIYLSKEGLRVDVMLSDSGRLKNIISENNNIEKIKKDFPDLLRDLKGSYEIILYDKIRKTVGYREDEWAEVSRYKLRLIDDFKKFRIKPAKAKKRAFINIENIENIFKVINLIQTPALSISTNFSVYDEIIKKDSLVEEVKSVLAELYPIIEFFYNFENPK